MEIAIVGVGKVAQDNYLPTLLRHKDLSLTCYSRTSEQAEATVQKFGVRQRGHWMSYLSESRKRFSF